ncbi:MAG: hypothetical protein KZQ86_10095, partial [Candidatus Thiodiazotropha sp. (ex Lucinoma kastoroae)]|nr:hypothetical protein [Candidatus Thiodiazotropha sp. (ex Lucinoma kastoroae)]
PLSRHGAFPAVIVAHAYTYCAGYVSLYYDDGFFYYFALFFLHGHFRHHPLSSSEEFRTGYKLTGLTADQISRQIFLVVDPAIDLQS